MTLTACAKISMALNKREFAVCVKPIFHIPFTHMVSTFICVFEELTLIAASKISSLKMKLNEENTCIYLMCQLGRKGMWNFAETTWKYIKTDPLGSVATFVKRSPSKAPIMLGMFGVELVTLTVKCKKTLFYHLAVSSRQSHKIIFLQHGKAFGSLGL